MHLRLALYSDQEILDNFAMDQRVLELIGKKNPRIGYISSSPDPTRNYFGSKLVYYSKLGAELCCYTDSENIDFKDTRKALLQFPSL